jgi:hypothetical protein
MYWNIGEFEFDALTGWLQGPVNSKRLNDKDAAVLKFLADNFGKRTPKRKLIAEVWGTSGGDYNLHQSIKRLRDALGGGRRDEYIASYPYRLVKRPLPLPNMDVPHELADIAIAQNSRFAAASGRPGADPNANESESTHSKFILSVDGIVLNSVGELIFERAREATIAECRSSYERALEDFAFALVYGSELRARWQRSDALTFPRDTDPEPAEFLIAELPPDSYRSEILDPRFHQDSIFEGDEHLDRVRKYIHCMGLKMRHTAFVRSCHDWVKRESEQYLGDHRSLFRKVKHPGERQFRKEYYRYELVKEIPKLLGEAELATLVSFVPERPSTGGPKADPYVQEARVQFVMENVLTHMATMYQFEKHAENAEVWRVPYGLRAEVIREASNTSAQRRLRSVLLGHALKFALDHISVFESRVALIEMLSTMRKISSFVELRQMLERLNLILLEPDPESERKANRLIDEIARMGQEESVDKASLRHSSVLREIGRAGPDGHRRRLYLLFPELAPRHLPAEIATSTRYSAGFPKKLQVLRLVA